MFYRVQPYINYEEELIGKKTSEGSEEQGTQDTPGDWERLQPLLRWHGPMTPS